MTKKKIYMIISLVLLALLIFSLSVYILYKSGVFDKLTEKDKTEVETQKESTKTAKGLEFVLTSPLPNSTVACEFKIIGDMPRSWFFEGSFPYEIKIADKVVYTGTAQTEDGDTTKELLHFVAKVECKDKCEGAGQIILKNANPSGLEDNSDSYMIPVTFPKCEVPVTTTAPTTVAATPSTMKIQAFFANSEEDPDSSRCPQVFPVTRTVPYTVAVGRASINELLKGPTEEEKKKKYFTAIPEGVVLKSLNIKDGVAYADFNSKLSDLGGSCSIDRAKSQINNTLIQYPSVKKVVISIEGKAEDILQP